MKKILSALLICFLFTFTACSGGGASITFLKPWVQESTDSTDQTCVYEIVRKDSDNVTIATGVATYDLKMSKVDNRVVYTLTTDYAVKYNSSAGDFSNKTDTYHSKLVFEGGSTTLMLPVSLEKAVTLETSPSFSYSANADYSDGLNLTYTYNSNEASQSHKAKSIASNQIYFDNEQLLLLVRSAPDWSAGVSFKTVSISDCIYSGKLQAYTMSATFSEDQKNVVIDTGLTHSIVESGDMISCTMATISLTDGMVKGPSINAYYASKTKSDSKYYRLLIKYVQYELDMSGKTLYTTSFTLKDVD